MVKKTKTITIMAPAPTRSVQRKKRTRSRRKAGRGFLGDLGGMVGNMLLPGLGGQLGQAGGNLIDGLIGGRSAPSNLANRVRSNIPNVSVQWGTEKLGTFTIPAGSEPGTLILQTLVSSKTLGQRMGTIAGLWDRVKFLDVAFQVTSSAPTSTPGNYIHAIDPDPVVVYVSGPELPNRMKSLTTSQSANAWAPMELVCKKDTQLCYTFYNVDTASDAEVREFAIGQYLFATNSTFPEDVDVTIDVIWRCHFERPVVASTQPTIAPPAPRTFKFSPPRNSIDWTRGNTRTIFFDLPTGVTTPWDGPATSQVGMLAYIGNDGRPIGFGVPVAVSYVGVSPDPESTRYTVTLTAVGDLDIPTLDYGVVAQIGLNIGMAVEVISLRNDVLLRKTGRTWHSNNKTAEHALWDDHCQQQALAKQAAKIEQKLALEKLELQMREASI